MMQSYFSRADVILENSNAIGYYFINNLLAVFIRKEDLSNSYTLQENNIDAMWQDIEDMLQDEYFDIVKGTTLINQNISGCP